MNIPIDYPASPLTCLMSKNVNHLNVAQMSYNEIMIKDLAKWKNTYTIFQILFAILEAFKDPDDVHYPQNKLNKEKAVLFKEDRDKYDEWAGKWMKTQFTRKRSYWPKNMFESKIWNLFKS